jgi:hypothetical protein
MLELNELCPPIIEKMMAAGDLPNFKRLHETSDVYQTWADDEDLEPWVQWVTLHTGTPQSVHGAKELDQGHLIRQTRLWDQLADDGVRSLIFGSMNARTEKPGVALVPDPWTKHVDPTNADFKVFHQFIASHVQEHTSVNAKLDTGAWLAFGSFMLRRGLSLGSISSAAKQLLGERTSGRDMRWGRALILDLLMWDVFASEYQATRPDFATFFANSTAFLQHRYWRHMSPDSYQVKPKPEEMAAYGSAVEDSYRHMDALVGRALKMVGSDGRIIFATALSQEANLRYEHIGGKFVYRPLDFQKLGKILGVSHATFEPVMTHQAWATFEDEASAIAFEAALAAFTANGKSIMEWRRQDTRVLFWCGFISQVDADLVVQSPTGPVKFHDVFHSLGQVNNSQHCRAGCFWVQRADRRSHVHAHPISLEAAHDLVLATFKNAKSALAA